MGNHEDLTFQMGVLGELQNELNIVNMEVWGLGDQDASDYQSKQLGYEKDCQMNRRKIDKKMFMSGFDQEHLFSNTFKHKQQMQDREDWWGYVMCIIADWNECVKLFLDIF